MASAIPAAAQTATPVDAQTQAPGTDPAAPVGSDTTTGAVAQTVAPEANAGSEIVVTGSRIARPTLDSPAPVTTLTIADLTRTGAITVGDVLNDLPSLRSTYSQASSTQFIGTSGLNFLDMRGLGVTRTLVLVNGRRHITSSEGDFLVDTNTIPTDLIERVDAVTGGQSAVYGSDAMAGVVNFVLKRNFEGPHAQRAERVERQGRSRHVSSQWYLRPELRRRPRQHRAEPRI
ncbi:TonB-dependent receptor plug domain-containing protein [Sphingomonas sp. H160509]|uniref:TonB-dependent receptor plug domain-containing protein n=1 Tax=Sphingomonas sp. H160509 TaxID=2955313 RepID=UPI0020979A7A|nr:TonB-dependent receptor plug domain-containing protein [Sphingomonas sp. H160509]MDD1450613.1 TonB-dependent receptor plug domain-containing protein [Sphingomonas sp. H160509]